MGNQNFKEEWSYIYLLVCIGIFLRSVGKRRMSWKILSVAEGTWKGRQTIYWLPLGLSEQPEKRFGTGWHSIKPRYVRLWFKSIGFEIRLTWASSHGFITFRLCGLKQDNIFLALVFLFVKWCPFYRLDSKKLLKVHMFEKPKVMLYQLLFKLPVGGRENGHAFVLTNSFVCSQENS